MQLGQVLEQRPTATPQLILANTLLQCSSAELQQTITTALAENPILELVDIHHCPWCGNALSDGACPSCDRPAERVSRPDDPAASDDPDRPDRARGTDGPAPAVYTTPGRWDGEAGEPVSSTDLSDHLLRQTRLSLPPKDLPIASFLIENLDDHGFMRREVDEVAAHLGVNRTRVERALAAIQEMDPVGIGARDARECLLIQLDYLSRQGIHQPLAQALLRDHWRALGSQSFSKVARALGTTVDGVQDALQFIKDNLNPYPAHAYWGDLHESPPPAAATYPRPDVIIIHGSGDVEAAYRVELPGEQAYQLRISEVYREATESLRSGRTALSEQDRETWQGFYDKARLLIKSVEQRWQTLRRLALHLVDWQRDFLTYGAKRLKPLTRAQLADMMDVHESTISRAVAGKYVQLPCGRIVPLATFFDRSAPTKACMQEIITQESTPLSDREIAEKLAEQGHHVARRTVTKYRNALSILPSLLR